MKWLLLLLLPNLLSAQDTNTHAFSLHLEYGSLILHSQDIYPIGPSNPYGAGINYHYWLLEEKNWENCLCYPNIGLSINYHSMDKPGILGWGIPFYAFLEPHFALNRKLFIKVQGGLGLSWFSTPYHQTRNPKNLSYSLYINPYIRLGSGMAYKLNDKYLLSLELNYNHISNGSFREPNKGLNYPTVSLGLQYTPSGLLLPDYSGSASPDYKNKRELSSSVFIAGKAIDASRVTYTVFGTDIKYSHQISRMNAIAGGVEWINNHAYKELISQLQTGEDHHQIGVLLGHEFLLGKFRFSQLFGVYAYRDFDIKPLLYQRYTLNWNPWMGFSMGTSIKVHGHVAEFLDFRMGYLHQLSGN